MEKDKPTKIPTSLKQVCTRIETHMFHINNFVRVIIYHYSNHKGTYPSSNITQSKI